MPDKFGNYTSEELNAILIARSIRPRAGANWTNGEEMKLKNAYIAGATIKELASAHARTQLAVKIKLSELGFNID